VRFGDLAIQQLSANPGYIFAEFSNSQQPSATVSIVSNFSAFFQHFQHFFQQFAEFSNTFAESRTQCCCSRLYNSTTVPVCTSFLHLNEDVAELSCEHSSWHLRQIHIDETLAHCMDPNRGK
jgi:hypothetical protein